MKQILRFLCVIMIFVMIASIPVQAEEVSPRASSFFWSYDSYLWKVSNTTFEVWFDVAACDWMDELGVSSIKVQRSSDGENWTTMRTYSSDNYPQLICEDTTGHAGSVSYTGTSGYYYRAQVTFYAKNSTGTGIRFDYAETIRL